MKEIFLAMEKEVAAGRSCYLLTLAESEGSTPRGSGAHLVAGVDGLLAGTIGGGAMEYEAVQYAQGMLVDLCATYNVVRHFDLSPGAGMACGGSCTVLFTLVGEDSRDAVRNALQACAEGKEYWLLLPWDENVSVDKKLAVAETTPCNDGRTQGRFALDDGSYYAEKFNYDGRVYIFGAGHVARELVPLLSHLKFNCTVLDDRADFADKAFFPEAASVRCVDYAHLEEQIAITERDYAVVMTRGHQFDAEAERFLLRTKAKYIGIMGSRHKARLAREALLAEGYSESQLERIVTPIGISINSETPAEIAISIAAQLIMVRNAK